MAERVQTRQDVRLIRDAAARVRHLEFLHAMAVRRQEGDKAKEYRQEMERIRALIRVKYHVLI